MFRTILVLDIFDGVVVHALRGKREEYLPVADFSSVCETSDAAGIARTLRPTEVYAADLNRIRGIGNNFQVIKDVTIADTVTIGTENADFDVIGDACETCDASRLHVNIDLMDGRILTNTGIALTPLDAVERLNDYPINHLIIIDLTKVGTESGIDLDLLSDALARSDHPVIFGGGVRDMNDLDLLRDVGVAGALVATGVHNRAMPVDILQW
jgi:phosphoribosylformimino-5-aminoimidazole carboxamide ribotide isomerase